MLVSFGEVAVDGVARVQKGSITALCGWSGLQKVLYGG